MIAKPEVETRVSASEKWRQRGAAARQSAAPIRRDLSGFLDPLHPSVKGSVAMNRRTILLERALPLAILTTAVVAVPVMIFSASGLNRLNSLRAERGRADQEISRLTQQIAELRSEVERIKTDPAAVERVARDELGLVRQTELVFQFKD
jgi:cell division protein FtsB